MEEHPADSMSPEFEDKIYQDILRSVIWGADRESVLHTLDVNGITGRRAEEMFLHAWKERISQIRFEALRKAFLGLGLLIMASILFAVFWYGFGAFTRMIYLICFVLGAWGIWWLADGVASALMAASRKGAISS